MFCLVVLAAAAAAAAAAAGHQHSSIYFHTRIIDTKVEKELV